MAAADVIWKQGDTYPVLTDTLTLSDGSVPPMQGATLMFVLRSESVSSAATVTGTATIVNPATGAVSYTPTTTDTDTLPGFYLGNWVLMPSGGGQMTFPTDGYLTVEIQESLTLSTPQQLVSLGDLKERLQIRADNRKNDATLVRWIESVRPIVEHITGPIIPQRFEEWHDGGQNYIMLRRRPSTAFGTSPVITLIGCSEYNGPIEWPLKVVQSPDVGQLYSVMVDQQLGRVVRRTAGGGGVQAFPYQDQAVHVVYQAGQSSIPANVYQGTLELLREAWMNTQQVGAGSQTVADAEPLGPSFMGSMLKPHIRELLMPNKRAPALA